MTRKLFPMVGGLIALYLVVVYSKGAASLISSSTGGATNVITALQGRSKTA